MKLTITSTLRAGLLKMVLRLALAALAAVHAAPAHSASLSVAEAAARLEGFDAYMERLLRDWNGVGFGVGILVGDEVVLAKGYGYRDYGRKLPFDAKTLFAIGSNTKLFTAVTAGQLVEEGLLRWDAPLRESMPHFQLYSPALTNTVTLRDMLSHRTGVANRNFIWYDSGFTGAELFDRLRFLEPEAELRERYLYNNMMYAAVGQVVAAKSGMPWSEFLQQRIFYPLGMSSTSVGIGRLRTAADAVVPFTERRDNEELYPLPIWEAADAGAAPAGAIVSNIDDLLRWLTALMNEGRYQNRQVLPAAVLKETLEPGIAMNNGTDAARGWHELVNPISSMGRMRAAYRGHLLTYYGGDLPGFHSQISFMPHERIGVIVLVIGDHTSKLYNPISYQIYERLLGLEPTPWSERLLDIRSKERQAQKEARARERAEQARVRNTRPSHRLADYVGEYQHPAYGLLEIALHSGQLQLHFRNVRVAMTHFHYDRFELPDQEGVEFLRVNRSIRFFTDHQGNVDAALISLDNTDVTFLRRPPRKRLDSEGVHLSRPPSDTAPQSVGSHAAGLAAEAQRIRVFESSFAAPSDAQESDGKPPAMATVAERMLHHGVPGMSIAVIRDGRLAWARAYGVLEAGQPDKVDTDTVFSVGSLSKVGAAAIALRLVDAGKLDLDRNVNDYLIRWKVPDNSFTARYPVTLRGILSHTAGLTVRGFWNYAPDEPLPTVLDTLEGRMPADNARQWGSDREGPVRVVYVPGSESRYSGGGTTVAQLVIEQTTDLPFDQAARRYLFEPLRMTRSTYQQPLPESHGNISKAHDQRGRSRAAEGLWKRHRDERKVAADTPHVPLRGYETMPEMAAAGLWASPSDYAKLVIALIDSYQGKPNSFLAPALARQMMTEVKPGSVGLGPFLSGAGQDRRFSHRGTNDSYTAYMEGHLATGNGVVVFTNSYGSSDLHKEATQAVALAEGWSVRSAAE